MSHKIKKVQQQPLQADLYDAAKIDLIYFILFYALVYYCFCIDLRVLRIGVNDLIWMCIQLATSN